jgi:alpha-tubulin suppressor-like RCC1 family protein
MTKNVFSGYIRATRATAICCALSWALVGSGTAALNVFQSDRDDLVDSGVAEIRGHTLLHVYFSNGPTEVTPTNRCTTNGGDEVCQWAVEFATSGNLAIVDVDWANPASVRAGTGGFAQIGDLGATKLATVAVTGTTGELRLYTPEGFGFVDKDGAPITVAAEGVLLGRARETGWKTVSSGATHTCGIAASGELRCWGAGPGTPPTGVFDSLAIGNDPPFCALGLDGEISCWGGGYVPPAMTYYEQIVAGENHFCGLTLDLELECWDSDTGAAALGVPTDPAPGPFVLITRGFNHVCGLYVDSGVECWGLNTNDQASAPTDGFAGLAGGARHTCGILAGDDGVVTCWGDDSAGQSVPPTPDPCPSYPLSCPFIEISAGDDHTCGILADQTVTCWGDDSSGQSSGPPDDNWTPSIGPDSWNSAPVTYETLSIASTHSCAIRTDGTLDCWGDNSSGQSAPSVVPMPQIAAGDDHACRIGTDGNVECWGAATGGAGTLPALEVVQLDAGKSFTCALEDDGDVHCYLRDRERRGARLLGKSRRLERSGPVRAGVVGCGSRVCAQDGRHRSLLLVRRADARAGDSARWGLREHQR